MNNFSSLPPGLSGHTAPTKPLNPERLLSRKEVQEIFGISKRFLEVAACRGDGPAFVKIGRLTSYRVQDLSDWIAAHRFVSTSDVDQRKKRG